jgi:putative oxygen-independent coproporphyrinogen III oxidase
MTPMRRAETLLQEVLTLPDDERAEIAGAETARKPRSRPTLQPKSGSRPSSVNPQPSEDRAAGLYLHIPFCSRICPYCDFAVLTGGRRHKAMFVERLLQEIALYAGTPLAFDTVYLGGGTPSALAPEELARVLEAVRASLDVAAGAWVFLEVNPEDVTAESAAAWRSLGVRTLSLGIQSFDPGALAFLGRRHGPEQAEKSLELARAAGFATVSLDLIYGLPGQTVEDWRRSLATAVRLQPDHLSCYQLMVEEGTPFGFRRERGELAELPEAAQVEFFLFTHSFLADAGYAGYEVSNFARSPEHRSRHNRKYWDHTPYLGLGPSAHSLAGNRRWWNERTLGRYEKRLAAGERPVAGDEELGRTELALEALMLGLRTADGIDLGRLRERYGLDLAARNGPLLANLAERGLLRFADGTVRPTLEGLAVADAMALSFDLGEGD